VGSRFDRERRWVKFCSWKTAPGHSPLLEQLCGLLSELDSRQSRCCDVPQIIYGQRANRDVAPEGTASVSVLLFCACWSSLPTTQPWRPALGSYRIASSHLKPRVGREYLHAKTPAVVEMAVGIAILTPWQVGACAASARLLCPVNLVVAGYFNIAVRDVVLRLGALVDAGRAGRRFKHAGEIQLTYRGQRRLPPAIGAQPADPSILVRQPCGI
jgi:hypothetical protein